MNARTTSKLTPALLVATLAGAACAPAPPPPAPFPENAPRLVLLLVVDQLSQEYLVRFRPLFDGGLARLLDAGVVFTDAHHNHASTVTGAGHATLASGCYPRRSGIVSNQWYDRDTGDQVYCVGDDVYRRSPANLLVDTFGDWLKQRDPASKVVAASGKDRSAILLGGHRADVALWFAAGDWVTSTYYDEPEWLESFNDRDWLDRFFGAQWEPLPVDEETLSEVGIATLDEGVFGRAFPYAFGSNSLAPDGSFYGGLLSSPVSDMYLAELARTMVIEEELGADGHPDVLALGFSALDYVGHDYGPNSREVLDTLLRLDDTLAELLAFLDERVGSEHMVIALSADHGVAPLPEYRQSLGESGGRADDASVACFQSVGRSLRQRYGDYDWLKVDLYLDHEAIAAAGLDRLEIEREIASQLEVCQGVERVWTRSELLAAGADAEGPTAGMGAEEGRFRGLYVNGYHPERSADFEIQYAPYYLGRRSGGTTHGTPYRYDTWVPLIVLAPGLSPARVTDRVNTADLAPTLAGIMGIEIPPGIDGVDRGAFMGGG